MGEDWPGPDECAALHQRLAAGDDPVASSDFAAAFLDPLVAFLRGTRHGADDHAIQTAAEDAVLSVIRRPAVFDPARGNLVSFLRMAATADLNNLRTKEARHQRNREDRECVELAGDGGNPSTSDDVPSNSRNSASAGPRRSPPCSASPTARPTNAPAR